MSDSLICNKSWQTTLESANSSCIHLTGDVAWMFTGLVIERVSCSTVNNTKTLFRTTRGGGRVAGCRRGYNKCFVKTYRKQNSLRSCTIKNSSEVEKTSRYICSSRDNAATCPSVLALLSFECVGRSRLTRANCAVCTVFSRRRTADVCLVGTENYNGVRSAVYRWIFNFERNQASERLTRWAIARIRGSAADFVIRWRTERARVFVWDQWYK